MSQIIRPRRLRQSAQLRALTQETHLSIDQFIQPLFIKAGKNIHEEIRSMPGQFQWSLDELPREIDELLEKNIQHIILFGIPAHKDAQGSDGYSSSGIIAEAVRTIKELAPNLNVITDCCLCEYTDHGHCGVLQGDTVDNDATLELLAKTALSQAQAGSNMIAPSAMMDGMVAAIRTTLDQNGYSQLPIMSYSVKYASSFYGPFREAAEGKPQFGDRRGYQMNYHNRHEALLEVELDLAQGADMIMVKPALAYLDIIALIHERYPHIPLSAYQVSGEYSMIKAACQNGWMDERSLVLESLTAIKRSGASSIISYYTKQLADWL